MHKRSLAFALLILNNLAFAGEYNFDLARKECLNSEGKVGRNQSLGICGDQIGVDLTQAQLSGRVLTGSDLSYAALSKAQLENVQLEYSLLNSASLDDANLRFARMSGTRAETAIFDRSTLDDADLRQANLKAASLVMASLKDAILSGADLSLASVSKANLDRARLRNAKIKGLKALDIRAEYSDFQGALAGEADFSRALLDSANFRDADLSKAIFSDADLQNVDFRNSNLKGAQMMAKNLNLADLRGAKFDSATRLPFGAAEAKSLGMIYDPSSAEDVGGKVSGEIAWRRPFSLGGDGKLLFDPSGAPYLESFRNNQIVFERLNSFDGKSLWSQKLPPGAYGTQSDCIDQGQALYSTKDSLLALDTATGQVLWTVSLPPFDGNASELKCSHESNSVIFIQKASNSVAFTALQKKKGTILWQFESSTLNYFESFDELNLYLYGYANSERQFGAVSMQTGALRWQSEGTYSLKTSNRIFKQDGDKLIFVDNMTGNVRWSFPFEGSLWNIEYGKKTIFFQVGGKLQVLNADSGQILWSYDLSAYPSMHVYAMYSEDNRISVTIRNQSANWTRFIVFDERTGAQLWEKTFDSYYMSVVAMTAEGYLIATPTRLMSLVSETGEIRWAIDPSSITGMTSSISFYLIGFQNGKVIMSFASSPPSRYPHVKLFALSEVDGKFLWKKSYEEASTVFTTDKNFLYISKRNPSGPGDEETVFMEALVR